MKQSGEFHYDFFISYSHRDAKWVCDWLLPHLEASGIVVCIDIRDFEAGAPSITEMERAVCTSRKTILVLSAHYLESEWTEFEAIMAQTLDPAARERRVIPLLLEKVDIPLRLSTLTYLDFSNRKNVEGQLKRLIRSMGKEPTHTDHPRILLVENEDSWIKITKSILSDCTVDDVRTSPEGIERLKAGIHYDLVLTNLNLTDVNEASGEEILEYIRDYRPSLPRIVVTGKPVRGPIHSTLFEGFQITELITKGDINIPELRHLVRKLLAPSHSSPIEYQEQKNVLINQLRQYYDDAVAHTIDGIKALNTYEIRLRREVGEDRAMELTQPDKETLLQKKAEYKNKYDLLLSRILTAKEPNEFIEIEKDFGSGW